jgi:phage terminase large subunit
MTAQSRSRVVELPESWDPRPDQQALWKYLVNGGLRAVEVAHRRWGKDDVALNFTCVAAMERPGNYWHMLPEYGQARKVIWTAINPRTGKRRIDDSFPVKYRKKTLEHEMSIELQNGAIWQLVGSDNYNALVGSPPVGIVFSEWALANPLAWAYLSPILEENKGWALFIYTSRGNNHGKTMLANARSDPQHWFAEVNPADRTPVFTSGQLEAIHHEYQVVFGLELGDALFLQEYMCSFEGAQLGSYYAKQIYDARTQGRITVVPYAPGSEVHTAWDLGVDDSMTIWFFQQVGLQYRFIDYYENTGYGLEHYAKHLRSKPYVYGNHYMPHDVEVREMTSLGDLAKTRREVAENLGIRPVITVERVKNIDMLIQVHIPAVRNILNQCWFDETKCAIGLSALESYAAEYDPENKVLKNRPAHNWASHAADAFRTFAVGYREAYILPPPSKRQNLARSYAINLQQR